jgi:hypothetical protein
MLSPPLRRTALASAVLGGALLAAHDVLQFRELSGLPLAQAALAPRYLPIAGAQLAGLVLLLLGLVGLHEAQGAKPDRWALPALLLAFAGVALAAGEAFFEVALLPGIAERAPEALYNPAASTLLALRATAAIALLGFLAFSLVVVRVGALDPRPAGLVAAGALLTALPLPLPLGGGLLLGAGFAWLGADAWRRQRATASTPAGAPAPG